MLNLHVNDKVIFIDLMDNQRTNGKVIGCKNGLVEIEYEKDGQVKRCKQYRNQVSKDLRKA